LERTTATSETVKKKARGPKAEKRGSVEKNVVFEGGASKPAKDRSLRHEKKRCHGTEQRMNAFGGGRAYQHSQKFPEMAKTTGIRERNKTGKGN